MPLLSTAIATRSARLVALAALMASLVPAHGATARPAAAPIIRASTTAAAARTVTETVGPAEASLESSEAAIPVDGTFSFATRVRVPADTPFVQMRLRILNPSGKLMFQRTRIQSNIETGVASAVFERTTSDFGLDPGAYPVELEIRISTENGIAEKTLESELLVYDPAKRPVPVVLALRISGTPHTGAGGQLVTHPAAETQARDDARRIATWLLANPSARATVSIPPVLLEEWRRLADGYEFTAEDGTVWRAAAGEPVPQAYADTLQVLKAAIGTGRFELVSTGYADPEIGALDANGLARDVSPQYAKGLSAAFASLETTPSTGTVPADVCLSPGALNGLREQGVTYAVVRSGCTESGDATASPGAYRVKGDTLSVLVADERAARAVEASDTARVIRIAFGRNVAEGQPTPLVIGAQLGADATDVESAIEAADALAGLSWARMMLAREAVPAKPRKTLALVDAEPSDAPSGFWKDVADARSWSRALSAAAGPATELAMNVERDSLAAENAAWAAPDGEWDFAERGLELAKSARDAARSVLDPIDLEVKSVTLAGTGGEVPVIITNGSDSTLALDVRAAAEGGLSVTGDAATRVEIPPQDTFVEIPVELRNALSGKITVTVSSGGRVLDRQSVTVRASYLDRLVMIVGVVVLLGILLAFIIRRVRAAEATGGSAETDEPTTPSTPRRRS